MNKRLGITNKRLQTLKNAPHVRECSGHDGIESEVIGRLIPSYPGYLDQYLSGAGEMHLHIGWLDRRAIIKMMDSVKVDIIRDYCIILQKILTNSQQSSPWDGYRQIPNGKTQSEVLPTTTDGDKLTVLICVFEAADDSQDVEVSVVPKVVRLQAYNECLSVWMQAVDCSLKFRPQFGVIDHELTTFVSSEDILKQDWETRIRSALSGGTGDNDIIKCTSQVMYEITEHDGNHGVRLLGNTKASPDLILAIRQPNACETVRVAACVPHGFLIDVYHVLLSPLELEPPVVHDMLYSNYGRQENEDTKNSKGFRNSNPQAQGSVRRNRKGGETHQTPSSPPPEEVKSRTAPFHRRGDYTAKHIHSGSLEDV